MINSIAQKMLKEKEVQGLYAVAVSRLFLLAAVIVAELSAQRSSTEVLVVCCVAAAILGISCFFVYDIYRFGEPGIVGYIGAVFDVIIMGVLPFVWYFALGGEAISPAFMTKTMYFFICFLLIFIYLLPLNWHYPAILTGGYVLSYVIVLFYVKHDPETVFSNTLLDIVKPDAVILTFQIAQLLGMAFAGMISAFAAYMCRNFLLDSAAAFPTEELRQEKIRETFFPSVNNGSSNSKDNKNQNAVYERNSNDVEEKKILEKTSTTKKVAVFFADIRDFSNLSNSLSAERVMDLLSMYRDVVMPVIKDLGGSVDRHDGDSIFATFGATMPRTTDAERAVRAAVRILNKLPELNKALMEKRLPPVNIGIGIHFGNVIVGTTSFYGSFERTIIGDTVDTVRRVESACRTTEKSILFTGAVREKLPENFVVRAVGYCKLRGKEEKLELFTVTSEPEM